MRHRIAFVEDYDIAVARTLYQGSDVWLNTPRRPMEACGTSGEKAALNGALNCSILDGWWDEMFDGANGWAISSAESYDDLDHRDQVEADSLFEMLERQIVPLFYDRFEGAGPPALGAAGQVVAAVARARGDGLADGARLRHRDVRADRGPGRPHGRRRPRPGPGPGRVEAAGRSSLGRGARWRTSTASRPPVADLWTTRDVDVEVGLGSLASDDVAVELLHGPVGPTGELTETSIVRLSLAGPLDDGYRYRGSFTCERAGRYGIAVRVVPSHPDLAVPAEIGCVTWA